LGGILHVPGREARFESQTGWIEHIIENMFNKKKVLPEVGAEWLIEAIFERHSPCSSPLSFST
jgi:hypothetical protein